MTETTGRKLARDLGEAGAAEQEDSHRLLRPGDTCWKVRTGSRLAAIIDVDAYFRLLAEVLPRAQRSIYVVGWDISSKVPLVRDEQGHGQEFAQFLNTIVHANPRLHCYVLAWDFAMLYALERELLPLFSLHWRSHPRLHFHMDAAHPFGGCQHQKLVVVDDRLAFAGGIDITRHRWDTTSHRPEEPARRTPDGEPYGPFHDAQMLMDGELAADAGELFRDRWRYATGRALVPPGPVEGPAPWPVGLSPDFPAADNVAAGLSRTFPDFQDRQAVHEVERLFLEAIAQARESLYLENQYCTSRAVTRALAERLREPDGPEVILVLPKSSSGWLEQATMDSLRLRTLHELADSDRHGRLLVLTPLNTAGEPVYVHSKITIVDDVLLRIGSANLTNRSMGLDSECDVAVEAGAGEEAAEANRQAVLRVRNRLLAEHLGVEPAQVARAVAEKGSLREAIRALGGDAREPLEDHKTLLRLDLEQEPPLDGVALVPDEELLDPERPAALDNLLSQFTEDDHNSSHGLLKLGLVLAVLLGMAAIWRFTPLGEWLDAERLAAFGMGVRDAWYAPLAGLGVFVIAGVAAVPVTLVVGATALVFAPEWGATLAAGFSLLGTAVGALAGYLTGRMLGRDTIRRVAGGKLNRLSKRLAKQGVLTMVVVRNLPVAPFTVVNMVAGASAIGLRSYLIGTLLGMAPGILIITLFTDRLVSVFKNPSLANVAAVVGVVAGLVLLMLWIRKRLSKPSGG